MTRRDREANPSDLELRRRAIAGDAPRDSSDPWALLEEVDDPRELPTVGEWLEAGGPMREVETWITTERGDRRRLVKRDGQWIWDELLDPGVDRGE